MAIVKCGECGAGVSNQAATCPKCGAPLKKPWGIIKTAFAVVFVMVVIAGVFGSIGENRSGGESSRPTKTPQQLAAERKADAEISRAAAFTRTLKSSMRNPDSFKLAQVLITGDGAVCVTYRAQNGFGGMNLASAVLPANGKGAKDQSEPGFQRLWNQECAEKPARDVTSGLGFML